MALFLPVVVGARSDRLVTRIGGRLPFVLAGAPVMALAMVVLGLQDALRPALAVVIVLFAAYYVAYEPYRAIYPDLVPQRDAGRSQSAQAVARGVGTGLALVGGGLLLAIAQIVPFVTAAGVLLATTGAFIWALLRRERPLQQEQVGAMRARAAFGEVRRLLVELPGLRAFFVANALWEGALGAIRTFVVLWVTTGLGLGLPATAGVIGAAGACVLVGAALAGRLAERFGTRRVVRATAVTYGAPMVVPFLFDDPALLVPMIPLISASAGVMMALPYAMLIPMMPRADHGLLTGVYSMSRGVGDRARPAPRRRSDPGPAGARHPTRDRRLLGSLAGRRADAARERAPARGCLSSRADAGVTRVAGAGRVVPGFRGADAACPARQRRKPRKWAFVRVMEDTGLEAVTSTLPG